MSELGLTVDVLGSLPENVDETTARNYAADLVKADTVSVKDANAALAAKNFTPLVEGSREYLEARFDALNRSDEFQKAYLAGDPQATAQFHALTLAMTQATGNLTDKGPAPAAYDALRREVGQHVTDAAAYETYSSELTGLASSIGMPPSNAASMAEQHFAAVKATAGMDANELTNWAEQQTAALHAAIGEGAEAKIAEASKVLSQKSGKKLDLAKIVRSNGAAVAVNLYFQSQTLNTRK